jgi:hypothetical protein
MFTSCGIDSATVGCNLDGEEQNSVKSLHNVTTRPSCGLVGAKLLKNHKKAPSTTLRKAKADLCM